MNFNFLSFILCLCFVLGGCTSEKPDIKGEENIIESSTGTNYSFYNIENLPNTNIFLSETAMIYFYDPVNSEYCYITDENIIKKVVDIIKKIEICPECRQNSQAESENQNSYRIDFYHYCEDEYPLFSLSFDRCIITQESSKIFCKVKSGDFISEIQRLINNI